MRINVNTVKNIKNKALLLAAKHRKAANPESSKEFEITIKLCMPKESEEYEEEDGEHETRSEMDSPKKRKLDLSGLLKK
jgi:hypothetical protein